MEINMNDKIYNQVVIEITNIANIDYEISELDKIDELGISSLKFIQLIVQLEDRFNISFDDDDIDFEKRYTINDIVQYIKQRLQKNDI